MAHSLSAKSCIRQNVTFNARNRWRLKIMRAKRSDFNEKLLHGSVADAKALVRQVVADPGPDGGRDHPQEQRRAVGPPGCPPSEEGREVQASPPTQSHRTIANAGVVFFCIGRAGGTARKR